MRTLLLSLVLGISAETAYLCAGEEADGSRLRRVVRQEEEKSGTNTFAAVHGEWKIRYSNKVTRRYTIEKNGNVIWDDKSIGRLTRTGGQLLLEQKRDEKIERLTLGTDGRLFIEHWRHTSHFPNGSFLFAIGIRQK